MPFNIGAGLSAAGEAISKWADNAATAQLKSQLERDQLTLSNQLLAEREHQARVETGEPEKVQAARLANAMQRAQIQATYDYLGLPAPDFLKDEAPAAAAPVGTSQPAAATRTVPAGPAGGAAATGVPSKGLLNTDVTGADAAGAGAGLGSFTKAGGGVAVDAKGKPGIAQGLPPGMTPQMARIMALTNPGKFFETIMKWQDPITWREGAPNTYWDPEQQKLLPIPGSEEAARSAQMTKLGAAAEYDLVDVYDPKTQRMVKMPKAQYLEMVAPDRSRGAAAAGPATAHAPTLAAEAPTRSIIPSPPPGRNDLGDQSDGSFKMEGGFTIPKAPERRDTGLSAQPSAIQAAEQTTYPKLLQSWAEAIDPAQKSEALLEIMAETFQSFKSGAWETAKSQIGAHLLASGMTTKAQVNQLLNTDPKNAQIIMHETFLQAMNALKAAGIPRVTQSEIFAMVSQSANPDLQPEANLELVAEGLAAARYTQKFAAGWLQAREMGYDPLTYENEFKRANNLKAYIDKTKEEIGPFKGMEPPPSPSRRQGGVNIPMKAPTKAAPTDPKTAPDGTEFMQGDWIYRKKGNEMLPVRKAEPGEIKAYNAYTGANQ